MLSTGAVTLVVLLIRNPYHSKWVKLKTVRCSVDVIVRVRVALKGTVVSD